MIPGVVDSTGECLLDQGDLASYPSDSDKQQEAVWAVAATDAFQWGYDPVHYGVPEGSYATNPDGPARIIEYRWAMLCQALTWVHLMQYKLSHVAFTKYWLYHVTCLIVYPQAALYL